MRNLFNRASGLRSLSHERRGMAVDRSGEAVAIVERNPIASEIIAVLLSSHTTAQKGIAALWEVCIRYETTHATIKDFRDDCE